MRSCTGWPSGTWIDPPRRTAPDGSNFQLQHWTHTFDYAVVAGDGDWRDGGLPAAQCRVRPTAARRRRPPRRTPGGLPDVGLAAGDRTRRRASRSARSRWSATRSRVAAPSTSTSPTASRCVWSRPSAAQPTSCCAPGCATSPTPGASRPAGATARPRHGDALRLHGYEIATVRAQLNLPRVLDGDHVTLAPDAELAQPLYARYWLHNRGPAPLGGLPVVAHLHPHTAVADPGAPVQLQLTAVSDCSDSVLHGRVRLVAAARAGRPNPTSCRSCCRPASTWRPTVDADDAVGHGARSVPGARRTRGHRQCVDSRVVAAGGRGRVRDLGRRRPTTRCCGWSPNRRPSTSPRASTATLSVTVGTDAYADLVAGGAPDQPVGDVGMAGARRHRCRNTGAGHRRPRLRRGTARRGWSPASGGR